MGLKSNRINSVMNYLKYVSYYILINGLLSEQFLPTRGLQQGDLILPCVFVIYIEVLSSSKLKVEYMKSISGVPIVRGSFQINLYLPLITYYFVMQLCRNGRICKEF